MASLAHVWESQMSTFGRGGIGDLVASGMPSGVSVAATRSCAAFSRAAFSRAVLSLVALSLPVPSLAERLHTSLRQL